MGAALRKPRGLVSGDIPVPAKVREYPPETKALIEVVTVAVLIAATIWLAPLLSRHLGTAREIGIGFALLIGAAVVGSEIFHHDHLADVGLRFDNIAQALGWLALPTAGLVLLMLGVGWSMGSLHFNERAFASIRLDWYGWMLIQQYLLQGFLNRRLQEIHGKGWQSVVLTAIIFAGFHLPNPMLMFATLIAGTLWAWVFQRVPNIFAIAVSHLILSFVLCHSLPMWVLPNAKVGWAFHW